jgi:hypothetical protein
MAYRIQFQLGREKGQRYFGNRYKEVQYERLIRHPKAVLRDVSEFLGIDYDPAMLEFSSSAKQLVAEDEKDWKGNITGPLLSDNLEKWRNELERRKIVRIENICDFVFRKSLYEKAYPNLTFQELVENLSLSPAIWMVEYAYKQRLSMKLHSVRGRLESNKGLH